MKKTYTNAVPDPNVELIYRSEAHWRAVFDNANTSYLFLDQDLKIHSFNQTAFDWAKQNMGVTLKEGENYISLLPLKDRKIALRNFHKVMDGEELKLEIEYTRPDCSTAWFRVCMNVVKGIKDEVWGIYIKSVNISKRKMAEAEIKALNASLEQKVLDRTAQLEQANIELEAFNYLVSHDLRNPLRAIQIFVSLLKNKQNIPQEMFSKYLTNIDECTTEMSELIDHLLEFSMVKHLGKQHLHKCWIKMGSFINEVFNSIQSLEKNKKINLTVINAPAIYADKILMKLVLVNLLSNAVKYSSGNEVIQVEVSGEEKNGFVEYYVKDNGIGFDPRYADNLFKPFSRLHSQREFKGSGAGLAIVDKVISFHKGYVRASSELCKGATFYFGLPVYVMSNESNKNGNC